MSNPVPFTSSRVDYDVVSPAVKFAGKTAKLAGTAIVLATVTSLTFKAMGYGAAAAAVPLVIGVVGAGGAAAAGAGVVAVTTYAFIKAIRGR